MIVMKINEIRNRHKPTRNLPYSFRDPVLEHEAVAQLIDNHLTRTYFLQEFRDFIIDTKSS